MKFEYDKNKSQVNKEKHGIDFVNAEKMLLKIPNYYLQLTFYHKQLFMP